MKQRILELKAQGKNYKEIKEIVGCSKSTVSYYCGENQKEKARIRTFRNKKNLCECGSPKQKESEFCRNCSSKKVRENILNKTINDFDKEYKDNFRYFSIRKYARLILQESGQKKECKICGFNHYVEACHIKSISSFEKDAKVSEVNNINNLIYLCPNHHKLLDLGLISL